MEDIDTKNAADSVEGRAELRRARRRRVLKRAQLIFGFAGSTIDCLVLDESRLGIQLETEGMVQFPEQMRIRFADGAIYVARRQWSTGNRAGLEFLGTRIYDEESQQHRIAVKAALKQQGVHVAVRMLRDVNYLKNEELREAAEAAELAFARLNAMLE
jgi:hypothetical protein